MSRYLVLAWVLTAAVGGLLVGLLLLAQGMFGV